jgi:DNA-binding PadR family transcriptional regulator
MHAYQATAGHCDPRGLLLSLARHHHHGRGRHGGRGKFWFGGPMGFGGPGGPGGPGPFGRGGGRARRGDVRTALITLLAEEPRNGYQLMQEIERRSEGVWRPSPGSVYPALQQLEDEGLVHAVEFEGKRAYELTEDGRRYIDDNRDDLGDPFAAATGGVDEGMMDMRGLMFQVGAAAMQVAAAGHTEEAKRILSETRRALYKILAEDEPTDA